MACLPDRGSRGGMASCGAVLMGTTDDPVPDAEGHDPDQYCRSTAAQ